MAKSSFTNRLSFGIMAVLIVISTIIMIAIFVITKDSMAREVEARYESVVLHQNEKIRGVRMFYETEISDDYAVQTNQEAVEALLRHLIENAIQYTDQGVITVATMEFENTLRTSVTDTGRGIPAERRPHVFDTFREMGDNQKLQGLGLSICQAIVKLLGGKIWLDENYKEGSRFVFELPKQ